MGLERIRIQNALIAVALAASFYPVTYDKDTHEASYGQDPGSFDADHTQVAPYGVPTSFITPAPTNALKRVAPASAECNEVSSTFGVSNRTRTLSHDRKAWLFELRLAFNQEVTIEAFEQYVLETPIYLACEPANGLRRIILRLIRSTPVHPARQEPNQGTRVTFQFEAELSPA